MKQQLKSWRRSSEITVSCEEYGKACPTFPLVISRPASERMKCILSCTKWGIISVEKALRGDMYHDG